MATSSHGIISVDPEGNVESVETTGIRETRGRLVQLAWLLDSSIRVPGTRFTVGLDALVGLFPFIGDLIGVLFSSYILSEAARLGAPKIVLTRMAFNVGLEGLVGIIPFAGDAFDAVFKANQRNVKLLNSWLDEPKKAERASRAFGIALVLGMVFFLLLLAGLAVALARWTWSLF
jgi:Domain of unknown function (DUF4112)